MAYSRRGEHRSPVKKCDIYEMLFCVLIYKISILICVVIVVYIDIILYKINCKNPHNSLM